MPLDLQTEGLFRVPGDRNKIKVLRAAFNRGFPPQTPVFIHIVSLVLGETPPFSEDEEVHLVCSLLKQYLSEIRDPLIPFALYGRQELQSSNR